MPPRRGFTLVEVIVAILLIDVGLLALVGGSAVLVRQTTELRARAAALRAATNRLELLGGAACVASNGTASGPLGVLEHWSVELRDNGVRDVSDSVTVDIAGVTKSVVLRTRLPC